MNVKSLQQSITSTIKRQGERLKGATPTLIAIALASGALIPLVQGDSKAALTLLTELGIATFSEFISEFLEKMREKYSKKKFKDEELQKELESELLSTWEGGGESAEALRRDISILLQSVHGVEKALAASSKELNEVLTQKFAALGGEFQEFRWVLDEIKDALADIQRKQTVQLATQKEQLEIQREQLTKTNLLLKMQREGGKRPILMEDKEEGESLPPVDIPCPYKGLAAFQPQDAEDFFGREELVAELLTRLTGTNFLGVVGPSGSGKSSVVRAGVIPSIWQGEIPGSDSWKTVIMTPGEKPLEELAVRIALQCGISAGSLMDDLKKDPANLRLGIKQVLAEKSEDAKLVLVVDQFEEVFTLCKDLEEREAYITALMSTIRESDSQAIVIIAMRADFYGRCAAYPELASILADNQVLVGAMGEDELRQAITLPAERLGLRLEPGLVEMVVREVEDEPGALPMLSHALMETWQRRSGNQLTVQGYLDSGGVSGSIAQTAETVYQELSDEQKAIARNLFLRMTEIGEGIKATSRRTEFSELVNGTSQDDKVWEVLYLLSDARLIIPGEEEVEVAHEALFDEWPTLQSWLEEDREGLRIHRQLTQASRQWEDLGKDSSILFRGIRLEQTAKWSKVHEESMNLLEESFLKASRSLQRRNRTLAITSLAFVFFMISLAAIIFNRQAVENQNIANTAQAEALARSQAEAEAIKERDIAFSKQLVAQSQLAQKNEFINLSSLLAMESYDISPSFEAKQILYENISLLPVENPLPKNEIGIKNIIVNSSGNLLATLDFNSVIEVWDVKTKENLYKIDDYNDISRDPRFYDSRDPFMFCDDDSKFVVFTQDKLIIFNSVTGDLLSEFIHPTEIWDIAISYDCQTIATSGHENFVNIWGGDNFELVNTIDVNHPIRRLDFSPDNQMLVFGGGDYFYIYVWDFERNQSILSTPFFHPSDDPSTLKFLPNSNSIIASKDDGSFQIIYLQKESDEFEEKWIYSEVAYESARLVISPNGESATFSGVDKVQIWDTQAGIENQRFDHTGDEINIVKFNHDNSRVATVSRNNFKIWDLSSGSLIAVGEVDTEINDFEFIPNSNIFISGHDRRPTIYEAENYYNDYIPYPEQLSFLMYGDQIPIQNDYSTLKIWDLGSDMSSINLNYKYSIENIEISNNEQYFIVESGPYIDLIETQSGKKIHSTSIQYRNTWKTVDFSLDSKKSAISIGLPDYKEYLVLDNASGEIIFTLNYEKFGSGDVEFSPDGEILAFGDLPTRGMITLINSDNGDKITEIGEEGIENTGKLLYSPDGRFLIYWYDEFIQVWDLNENKLFSSIETKDTHNYKEIHFMDNGDLLINYAHEGIIEIWDIEKNEKLVDFYNSENSKFAIGDNGKILAIAGDDMVVSIWDISSEEKIIDFQQDGLINKLSLSSDGKYLALGSNDNTIKIFEIETGNQISQISQQGIIQEISYLNNENWILVGTSQGYVKLINLEYENLMRSICSRLTRNLTWKEWNNYFQTSEYRQTCIGVSTFQTVEEILSIANELAYIGEIEEAIKYYELALNIDPNIQIEPEVEAGKFYAKGLVLSSNTLAYNTEVEEAEKLLLEAKKYNPNLVFDEKDLILRFLIEDNHNTTNWLLEDNKWEFALDRIYLAIELYSNGNYQYDPFFDIASPLYDIGKYLAQNGNIEKALEVYNVARPWKYNYEGTNNPWSYLCWYGALWGYSSEVIGDCHIEVQNDPTSAPLIQSRGLLRVFLDDYEGAISDFKFYVNWAESYKNKSDIVDERLDWISQLEQGINPFDLDTIEKLKIARSFY